MGDRTVATSDKNHIDALVERSPRLTRAGILYLRLEPEDVVVRPATLDLGPQALRIRDG